MRKCLSTAKADIQEIQYLADIILGYAEEKPTEGNIKRIKGVGKRIKGITEVWND